MVDVCLKIRALLHFSKQILSQNQAINFQILGTHPLFKENQGEWWKHLPSLSTMSFSLAQDHVSSRAGCGNSQAAWRSNEGWDGYYWWYWWLLITQSMFTSSKPFFSSFFWQVVSIVKVFRFHVRCSIQWVQSHWKNPSASSILFFSRCFPPTPSWNSFLWMSMDNVIANVVLVVQFAWYPYCCCVNYRFPRHFCLAEYKIKLNMKLNMNTHISLCCSGVFLLYTEAETFFLPGENEKLFDWRTFIE